MLYFIKGDTVHQYPVARGCGAVYQDEPLRDTILHGVKECPYCLGEWPSNRR